MNRPHILEVTPYYPPAFEFGGPVRLVSELNLELVDNFDVHVFTYRYPTTHSWMDDPRVHVQRFLPLSARLSKQRNIYYGRAMIRAIHAQLPIFQLVHTHDFRSFHNIALARWCAQKKIPLVMSTYQSILTTTGQTGMKKFFDMLAGNRMLQRITHFIAVNTFEQEALTARGIAQKRITIIPNCIATPTAPTARGLFRAQHHISPQKKIILFFARLDRLKRPDIVVDAFARLRGKHPDALLVICGPDAGELDALRQQIAVLKLGHDTLVLPIALGEKKNTLYRDADILALPSPHHEFPLVLLEAMAAGLPIVTAERSIMNVLHQRAGFVVEPSVDAFTHALDTLLRDDAQRKKFGLQGPQIFRDHFTFARYTKSVTELYSRLIASNPSSTVV